MALGVANAQTVMPAITNATTVLPTSSTTGTQSATSVLPSNAKLVSVPVTSGTQTVASADHTSTVETPNSVAGSRSCLVVNNSDNASTGLQNSNIHQKLMEQLTNSVSKNNSGQESDFNNEELIEFMRLIYSYAFFLWLMLLSGL